MPEKKRVTFANTAGKSLTNVREIERVGKSYKIKHAPRKSTPADLKKLKAKHEAAEKRALAELFRAEDILDKAKRVDANMNKMQKQLKTQLAKEKKLEAINNIHNKLGRLDNAKKNLAPRINNLKIDVNLAKNKLKAQRAIGLKKSRFTFV
jgi:predicted  nucleic acid-binding Zn-ribbon protein